MNPMIQKTYENIRKQISALLIGDAGFKMYAGCAQKR